MSSMMPPRARSESKRRAGSRGAGLGGSVEAVVAKCGRRSGRSGWEMLPRAEEAPHDAGPHRYVPLANSDSDNLEVECGRGVETRCAALEHD